MAKHRKTRREKIRSDFRTEHVIASPAEKTEAPQIETQKLYTYSSKEKTTKPQLSPRISVQKAEYAYLQKDLRKIGFVTGGIIVAQFALFMLLNR